MRPLLITLLCLISTMAWGQSCPPDGWCKVQDRRARPQSMPKDNDWNNIFFAPATRRMYIYADDVKSPPTWETSFWSYKVQKEPQTANVWEKVSGCGDTMQTSVRQQRMELHSAIGAADRTLQLDIMNPPHGALERPNFPQPGTIWVGDEAMDFTRCSCAANPDSCPAGCSSPLTISGLKRGVRQGAGWLPARPHSAHEAANLACPGPFVSGYDHPISRHPVGCTTYDSKRGRIWEAWGTQEIWKLQDTWYLCVFPTAFCTAAQIRAGWQRLPLFSTGGANPGHIAENAMVYDPDHDVIVEFGGTSGGRAINDTFVFCLSAGPGAAYGCTSPEHLNKWIHVSSYHGGSPAESDADRMTYDSTHRRVLIYGGNNRLGLSSLVQQYDAGSGDWCMSDTRLGGSNSRAEWCKRLPKVRYPREGHPPGMRYPAWTFDTKRGKAAFYAGPNGFYQYDAEANSWTLSAVRGGPALPEVKASQSMAYADDPDDTYVWKSTQELWQLPGTALSGGNKETDKEGKP